MGSLYDIGNFRRVIEKGFEVDNTHGINSNKTKYCYKIKSLLELIGRQTR